MNLLNTTLKNSIQVMVRFVISILNIKIIAVLVGPSGMALVSQLLNTLQLGTNVANLGFREGMVKYISQYKDEPEARNEYISTSILAVLGTSIVLGVIALIFAKGIAIYTLKDELYTPVFRFVGIYFIATSLLNLLLSILNGLEKQKHFILLNIILSISGFLIALGAVLQWGLEGLLWAQILATSIAFIAGIVVYKKAVKVKVKSFHPAIIKKLSKYSLMTLFSAITAPLLYIAIRNTIIDNMSLDIAGLWDGMNRITSNYILIITSAFSYYFIPAFSKLETKKEISHEVFKAYKLLAPLLFVGGLIIFFGKDLVIKILFSEEFEGMRPLFIWQTIGDFFRVLSWVIGMLFIAKARIKTFITTEAISIAIQLLLVRYITSHMGMEYTNLYYAISFFVYFVMMYGIFHFYYVKK